MEIANLGVLGRPEHRTPVGEKIQEAIFRALQDTEIPNTGCFRAQAFGTPTAAWGTSLGSIFLAVCGTLEHRTPVEEKIWNAFLRGLRKTGTPDTEKKKIQGARFYQSSEDRRTPDTRRPIELGEI